MNRFANYYKKIFSQEYIDRTISGGIKSQLTLLLVTIATALAIFFIIAMLFSIQLHGHEEWGERLWAVYNNFVDPGNQIEETAWPNRILVGQEFRGCRFMSFFLPVLWKCCNISGWWKHWGSRTVQPESFWALRSIGRT